MSAGRTERLLGRVADAIERRPNLVLVAGIALGALSALAAHHRLRLETGRDQMISADKEFFQHYRAFKDDFPNEGFLIVVLEVDDRATAAAALQDVMGTIEAASGDDVRGVFFRKGQGFFREHGLLYADDEGFRKAIGHLERLGDFASAKTLQELLARIADQMGSAGEGDVGAEDLRFLESLLDSIAGRLRGAPGSNFGRLVESAEEPFDPLADHFVSPDGKYVYGYVVPREDTTDLVEARSALELVRGAIARTKSKYPDQVIALTGRPAVDSDEMATATTDMTRATTLGFLGVALLFFLQFHSPVRTAVAMLTLSLGIAWAFGLATIWPGRLTLLSIVFAAVLVGLGNDFGVYLLTRFEAERANGHSTPAALRRAMVRAGAPIFIGALTMALAFWTGFLIDFRGLAELGFIAGSGILLCFVAVMTVLPASILWLESRRPTELPTELPGPLARSPFKGRRFPLAVVVVSAVLTALCVPALFRIRFDSDPSRLQARGLESVEYERKLVEHSKHSTWFGASIVPGRDLVELRRRSEAFRALPEVGAVDSILDALPAPGSEARIPILRQVAAKLPRPHSQRFPAVDPAAIDAVLAELLDEVQAWMDAVLLRPDAGEALPALERLEAAIHDVRKAHAEAGDRARAGYEAFESDFFPWIDELVAEGIRPMLRVESVSLERLPAFYRTVFVSKDGSSYCLHVHPEHDPNVPGNRATYVQKCRAVDPEFTGAPVVFHHVSGLMLDGFQSATGYALLVIVVVVALSSSHWIDAPLSLIPIAVGLLWLLGAMAVFDIPFNLANFFGVPILIGAGVDAGVHLVHRFREGGPVEAAWRETGKGIFTANLSNVIGFGAMLVAGHRGIFGLGLLVSIGLTMELLAALIVLPAVLRLIEPRY